MCLRVASAVPAGGSAPGNPGAPAAPADVLPGVCVAGCNNTLAQLGA